MECVCTQDITNKIVKCDLVAILLNDHLGAIVTNLL